MDNENLHIDRKSSEEVQDIIDRMPSRSGRIVALIVVVITGLLLFFGWKIEYPEKVTGPVTITARQAPVRLVANNSGKLKLLKSNSDTVIENEIIGYIENPAKLEDILKIEEYLMRFHRIHFFLLQLFLIH